MDPAAQTFIIGAVIGGVFGLAGSLSERLVRAGAAIAAIAMAYVIVGEGGILALEKTVREMLSGAFSKPSLALGIVFGLILMADEDSPIMGGGTNQGNSGN